ncbi:FbpB family small basic protein [Halobacillus litoralis]|nr:FbpB family small basic protein [Halobacillus litoralis]MCA0969470.1 FbpB family small basic protein [Halobacillus litoralis]
MRSSRMSFEHLVDQNKKQLLNDEKELEKIEKKMDEKHSQKTKEKSLIN